jgi:hypothetical protein
VVESRTVLNLKSHPNEFQFSDLLAFLSDFCTFIEGIY